jgi:hypothetical protein
MAPRVQQVMQQARARIFGGDTHVGGKLVSVFEPGTEVIRKGKAGKPTGFGKMVKIQEAENRIIVSYAVYEKRPYDSALLIPAIESHEEQLGCVPRLVAGDAALCADRATGGRQDLDLPSVARLCYTAQISTAWRSDSSGSLTGKNSCETNPVNPRSAMACATAR